MLRTIFDRAGRASALPALWIAAMILLLGAGGHAEERVTVCILDSGCNAPEAVGEGFLGDSENIEDCIGHGTQIYSLVRAAAPQANIVVLKCFDSWDSVDENALIAALYAAVDEYHADVINMSWTRAEESDALYEAIVHAHEQGALLVASAGNLSLNTGLGTAAYPAAWDEVIGIAGVDMDEAGQVKTSLWYLYGEAVDFCARGDCGEEKGSSYAAARVSGLIARLLQDGTDRAQLSDRLADMAQDLGEPGRDDRFGWGYLEIQE